MVKKYWIRGVSWRKIERKIREEGKLIELDKDDGRMSDNKSDGGGLEESEAYFSESEFWIKSYQWQRTYFVHK